MKKFSVIMPTMWFSKRTVPLIRDLIDTDFVSEIIIIDNNTGAKPNLPQSDKIVTLTQKKNIYVNPSWNLGVKTSSEENLCIINDDVSARWSDIFGFVSDLDWDKYCIGIHPVSYKYDEPMIRVVDGSHIGKGWGCCIFLSKKEWVDVPDGIKINFGDNFIVDSYGDPKSLMAYIETDMSTTSASPLLLRDQGFSDIKSQDAINYDANRSKWIRR